MKNKKHKKVYLVGAGPGAKDLISVRGTNILDQAEVVIYDYLASGRLLEYANNSAELICCDEIDNSRRHGNITKSHQKIGELIIDKVKQGKKVVRLKNGTPVMFGRCRQELELLEKNSIPYELVPGITASNAASCYAGISLTDRDISSSCVFVTGKESSHKKESLIDWDKISKEKSIVLYMSVGNLRKVVNRLIENGKSSQTPVAVIEKAASAVQKSIRSDLENVVRETEKNNINPPAIIIVGEVVKLERDFNWLRRNKKVLFTGLSEKRFFISGTYYHLPMIKIIPMENYTEFDAYLRKISEFDWIFFTSRYGVKYFFKRLKTNKLDSRKLKGVKIAAIGNSTGNRLLSYGIQPDLIPEEECSSGLVSKFVKFLCNSNKNQKRNPKIFLPRSDLSDKGLTDKLTKLGAKTTTSFAYKNVMPENLPDLNLDFFDEIMFTSPSTVRNFKSRYGNVPNSVKIKTIGKVTSKEVEKCNIGN